MKELAVYIHIPFCVQKCRYCDFLSGPAHLDKLDEYIDMLCVEMEQYKEFVKEYKIRSIFLGGGTPSILSASQIKRVMTALQEKIIGDRLIYGAEVTIESNPGTLTEEKLNAYLELGINRISMGLQSTFDDELRNLGRIHTYEAFLDGYELARKAGFKNINVDLMSGLPNQTLEKWETTLKRIVDLKPEHISAYSLIIEEGTEFEKIYGTEEGEAELPDEELDRIMYQKTKELLKKSGYERYEISNYAKPGFESRHNCSYWTGIEYLGLGLGASSLIQKKRYRNEDKMRYYLEKLSKNQSVQKLEEELEPEDEMVEFMILGLRMMNGVQIEEFRRRFGQNIDSVYGEMIQKLEKLQMLEENNGWLRLTEKGIDVSNEVFTNFLKIT